MGSSALGDLPSGALAGAVVSHASLASDGTQTSYGNIGANNWRAPQDVILVDAFWEPTGADNAATSTASYRRAAIIDAGLDGAGTRVLASVNLTASQASNTLKTMTLIDTPTVAKGHVVAFQLGATVGGAQATDTVVRAGNARTTYRPI